MKGGKRRGGGGERIPRGHKGFGEEINRTELTVTGRQESNHGILKLS